MHPKLAAFHVSWYMGHNNSPSMEYTFFQAFKDIVLSSFWREVGVAIISFWFWKYFLAYSQTTGPSAFCWYCKSLNLCRFIFTHQSVMFITKSSNILAAFDTLAPFTYHWYGRTNVMLCSAACPDLGPFKSYCNTGWESWHGLGQDH